LIFVATTHIIFRGKELTVMVSSNEIEGEITTSINKLIHKPLDRCNISRVLLMKTRQLCMELFQRRYIETKIRKLRHSNVNVLSRKRICHEQTSRATDHSYKLLLIQRC